MFGSSGSPWFALLATVICIALAANVVRIIMRSRFDDEDVFSTAAWYSTGGAVLAFAVAMFVFFYGATAGEADPRPPQVEGMTEINAKAPPPAPPTGRESDKSVLKETSKSVKEHTKEADDSINRAIKRAQERDGK